ncbi:UPF0488 protein C8orf33 homolog [Contarinia nasturtii]|uniref:UPF0488 protein C8orf33 homolog n=1 Tax=Contarinia nasturtii TaxID=265458 RepID=UPI0012D3A847|nr:UPF0488 protein C8orf33 homolog [Contarinia nasturtii]
MPPPKAKLHSSTGRLKNITTSSTSNSNESQQNVSNRNISNTQTNRNSVPSNERGIEPRDQLDQAREQLNQAVEQFELELYWCIQTLENSLSSGKLNAKQAQDAEKTLKLLKGNNQPIVKKRQLMSCTFGDYRKKMADEEKKLRVGNTSIQFVEPSTKDQSTSNKSHFVKKSFASTLGSAPNFLFNFSVNAMEKLSIDAPTEQQCDSIIDSVNNTINEQAKSCTRNENDNQSTSETSQEIAEKSSDVSINKSKFITSDNSFKFNFVVEND